MIAKEIKMYPVFNTRGATSLSGKMGSVNTSYDDNHFLPRKVATLHAQISKMEDDYLGLGFNFHSTIHKSSLGNYDRFDLIRNAKLQKHAEELKSTQRFISFQTQGIILEMRRAMKRLGNNCEAWKEYSVDEVLPSFSAKDPAKKSGTVELDHNVMLMINEAFVEKMIKSLNKMLCELNLLKTEPIHGERNYKVTELQSIVFHQIDYMLKSNLISEVHLKKFLKMENTLEVAAQNLIETSKIKYRSCPYYSIFPSRKVIHRNRHYAHFRSFFKVLEDHDQRYFCFLIMKGFLQWHMDETKHFKESSWPDDLLDNKLFYLLEDWLEQKNQLEPTKFNNRDESEIELEPLSQFSELKHVFDLGGGNMYKKIVDRTICFFVLEFYQENYGTKFLKDQSDNRILSSRVSLSFPIFEAIEKVKNLEIEVKESMSSKSLARHYCALCKKPERNAEYYLNEVSRIYSESDDVISNITYLHYLQAPEIYYVIQEFKKTKEYINEFLHKSNFKCEHLEKVLVEECNSISESQNSSFSLIISYWTKLKNLIS
ncbi:hypothetical protein PGT21_003766 [Puccinia graminis f. sp. tritici]|uniref:Uncharacterized protein n=1 Tax=Puccinia graminis f. sp. tritici TaxID=56615 RepID=A0A5B0N7S5_PUCGR|nr:hypothetical protein PGT21_003766 [Puccinia graminis f. sp. tritici]KAA1118432.1 hypothetical protein PGTUg99_003536 [Puccinia graminis f. sp. tritici]